jgi:hypothetical protein
MQIFIIGVITAEDTKPAWSMSHQRLTSGLFTFSCGEEDELYGSGNN